MSWRFSTVILRRWHTSITHLIPKWPLGGHMKSLFFSQSLPYVFLKSHHHHHRKLANSQLGCLSMQTHSAENIFETTYTKGHERQCRDNVVLLPTHDGFVGGDAANVLPAVIHLIGQAVTRILKGDWPESKTGLGREGSEDGSGRWTCSVLGSMVYCHSPVVSNSRSTARGCCVFCARTFWLLGTFEKENEWMTKMNGTWSRKKTHCQTQSWKDCDVQRSIRSVFLPRNRILARAVLSFPPTRTCDDVGRQIEDKLGCTSRDRNSQKPIPRRPNCFFQSPVDGDDPPNDPTRNSNVVLERRSSDGRGQCIAERVDGIDIDRNAVTFLNSQVRRCNFFLVSNEMNNSDARIVETE